ncbi:O-succinylbenzoate-CoA synthase [Shigella flexneri]
MRSAQVYRWQIPMDAGVILRDRRLKTRDGLYVCLRDGEREGWGESPRCRASVRKAGKSANRVAGLGERLAARGCLLPQLPSVAFGVSCALAELAR